MNKKFNYKPLIEYTDYAGRKYIKPEKAGDLKEDMELFRKNGQNARKIFTEIAKSVEENVEGFHLQKVSSWMNQGQVARPYLWVFLKQDGDTENESGIALRVFKNEKTKKVGISMEVSFVERKLEKILLKDRIRFQTCQLRSHFIILCNFQKVKKTVYWIELKEVKKIGKNYLKI